MADLTVFDFSTWAVAALFLSISSCVAHILVQRYRSTLRSTPGPFLASFTNLWRFLKVYEGRFELALQAEHDKHGDLVRAGPNCVSVGDPREIRQIYGISRLFQKSDYYRVAQPILNGKPVASLFMITDEDAHKAAKRPIAHAYAMTSLLDYEPFVDNTSKVLVERLTTLYANSGKLCDFGEWLQWYAFDVIGEMTMSKRFGFLEQGRDVNDIIKTLNNSGAYTAIVGQMPWLDYVLAKNPYWGHLFSKDKLGISKFVLGYLQPRIEEASLRKQQGASATKEKKPVETRADFCAKFIAAFEKYAGQIPQSQLLGWSLSNINAGSDTTAITLRAIFHFLLLHPATLSTLVSELKTAKLSEIPTFRETSNLPYLAAVIKESLRLHTPVGLILERIVPEGGVTLCGHYFPAGTIVGCNPAVIHQDSRVFGRRYSVDEFRPERWLEADTEELAEMERCFMAFGAGKRTCIGKNISLLEVHKLVPLLLMNFKFTLADPNKKLMIWNTFFVHQKGLEVYVQKA
ncbi:cytochrome P450 [Exophiala viscosa]|uniref:cytochrome P450 n=1 Tax=Exophiala viscosa TaxID=2486360 RepID=UPI00219F03EE|nr:cytochrome P450 [Exophiala viscosa]